MVYVMISVLCIYYIKTILPRSLFSVKVGRPHRERNIYQWGIFFVKDRIDMEEVTLVYKNTSDMIADFSLNLCRVKYFARCEIGAVQRGTWLDEVGCTASRYNHGRHSDSETIRHICVIISQEYVVYNGTEYAMSTYIHKLYKVIIEWIHI